VTPAFVPPPLAQAFKKDLLRVWEFYFQRTQPAAVGFAQTHQESRWKPDAKSKFAAGLAQMTPATAPWIHAMLPADVRAACPTASGCPLDPRWSLWALGKYDRLLWGQMTWAANDREHWGASLAAYNGGSGHIQKERRACVLPACDPARYFGHVQRMCGAGGRAAWACEENTRYAPVILDKYMPLYASWLKGGRL
jgi:membrane-bound lytic murein transglycosylase MltF